MELCVTTKESEESINLQSDPDRWYYEVQALTKLFLSEDYDAVYARLGTTLETVRVIEEARKAAGILFPGD